MKNNLKIFFLIILCVGCISEKSEKIPKDYYDRFKNTPLHKVALAVDQDSYKRIIQLLKGKSDSIVNYKDPYVEIPLLWYAAQKEKYDACKALLELGANPDLICKDSISTPFIKACKRSEKIASLMLKHGANVNTEITVNKPCHSRTPLIAASEKKKNLQLAKILIKKGANVNYNWTNSISKSNTNAFSTANMYFNFELMEYLLDSTSLNFNIFKRNKYSLLKTLKRREADLDRVRMHPDTLLLNKNKMKKIITIIKERLKIKSTDL